MKLYYSFVAPNPTRVRTYVREKGIELEMVLVDLTKGEHRLDAHLARNPAGTLPVLELDSGDYLTESLTIMEYLEALYPEPPMLGTDLMSRTRILEAERKIEINVTMRIIRLIHATNSPLGLPRNEGIAESERRNLPNGLGQVNDWLEGKSFVMGDQPTIADCTLFGGCFFGEFFSWKIPDEYPNLQRWYAEFKTRPSAAL